VSGQPLLRSTRVRATPRARRAIHRLGADERQLRGTGPGGRIVQADVREASGSRRPLGSMRRAIAARLAASKQTIPHFYARQTVEADALTAFAAEKKAAYRCSLNDVILKAVALAVREFPAFRSRLDGDDIVESADVHLGVAVGLADGVVVPSLLHADSLSLEDLAAQSRRIVAAARERRIENMGRSVFSVSNLGMYGLEEFTAVINPPEAAILAVGAVRDQPLVRGGALVPGQALTFVLSCDHRLIDGLAAAQFMGRLRQILEAPDRHIR
jgi:pyruvate dehydrogenase E2 component (dihydrolipoamide acetyltransferase)